MTYGGFEFIKMIQKTNKITCTFLLVLGGEQYEPGGTACPPGTKIIRVWARYLGQLALQGVR